MRSRVEHIAELLGRQLEEKQEAELIEDFSIPLAGTIICELIGVDEADRAEIRRSIYSYSSDPTRIGESAHHVVSYTEGLIERRRAEPGRDDLISKLVTTVEDGDQLTDSEIIAMILLLVLNGLHTIAHFVPSAALALFDHPDQLARLRAEPTLLPHTVNELLRTASPVTIGVMMYAVEDLEFAGAQIKRGDAVTTCLSSANHDPRVFTEPERLDITRVPEPSRNHVALYHGPHYCLGGALAQLESEVAIDQLFLKRDGISLAIERDKVEYHSNPIGSLLARLPVRL